MVETGQKQDDRKPVLSECGCTMNAFNICNCEFIKIIFKPSAARDQRKYMRTIIVATSKLPVKTQINRIHELDSYFPLFVTCTDNVSLELHDKKDIVFVMFSSDFQAALKTHTTNYEKLTVDEVTDFYEQFETNEARKKANSEYS